MAKLELTEKPLRAARPPPGPDNPALDALIRDELARSTARQSLLAVRSHVEPVSSMTNRVGFSSSDPQPPTARCRAGDPR